MNRTSDSTEGQNQLKSSVLLAFGSNLGDKKANISKALHYISEFDSIELVRSSSFYLTQPMGIKEQPTYINSAALIKTSLNPNQLLETLRAIELKIGRRPREKWHEREIDIDILVFDDIVIDNKNLTIPHKGMHLRNFVLIPSVEIAPDIIHPIFGKTILELRKNCTDMLEVVLAK